MVNRSAAKAELLKKFTDPDRAPFPGAVRMMCSECGRFIVWVNPPLPSNGKTVCEGCA